MQQVNLAPVFGIADARRKAALLIPRPHDHGAEALWREPAQELLAAILVVIGKRTQLAPADVAAFWRALHQPERDQIEQWADDERTQSDARRIFQTFLTKTSQEQADTFACLNNYLTVYMIVSPATHAKR